MWRGKNWKSSILLPEDGAKNDQSSETDSSESPSLYTGNLLECEDKEESPNSSNLFKEGMNADNGFIDGSEAGSEVEDKSSMKDDVTLEVNIAIPPQTNDLGNDNVDREPTSSMQSGPGSDADVNDNLGDDTSQANCESAVSSACTEGVLYLLREAVESGSALILDNSSLDADMVYERSVALAQVASPGPVFRHHPPKVAVKKRGYKKTVNPVKEETVPVASPVDVNKSNEKKVKERKSSRTSTENNLKQESQLLDVVPQGSLQIDELAKLLT